MRDIHIDEVQFTAASPEQVESGLLGWITCRLNRFLQLNGIALRRTADGKRALSFPARRDGAGRRRFFVRPLDDQARRQVEQQVFAALGIQA